MQFISNSIKDTHHYAAQLLPCLKTNLICLSGPLGAGKTTFVQGLAQALGIRKRIISPTFVLVRQYKIKIHQSSAINHQSLIHIDCYRLKSELDAKSFNFQELWSNKKNLVVVEWPEKIKTILPKNRIEIKFKHISENKRKIIIDR